MAVQFAGLNGGHYALTGANHPNSTGEDWTIATRVRFHTLTVDNYPQRVVWINTTVALDDFVSVYHDLNGELWCACYSNGVEVGTQSLGVMQADRNYHLAVVHESGVATRAYLNGELKATLAPAVITVEDCALAGINLGVGTHTQLHGAFACFRYWRAALSQAEIQAEIGSESAVRLVNLWGSWRLSTAAYPYLLDDAGVRNMSNLDGTNDSTYEGDLPIQLVAFVGVNTQALNNNTITVATPAGDVGDVLVFSVAMDARTGVINSWPSGFTPVTGTPLQITNDGHSFHVAWKIADGTESNLVAVASSDGSGHCAFVARYTGQDQDAPINVSGVSVFNGPGTSPMDVVGSSITTTVAGCTILYIAALDVRAATSNADGTAPSGFTERVDLAGTNLWSSIYLADGVQGDAGATGDITGSFTFENGDAGYGVFLIALAPAEGGGSTDITGNLSTTEASDTLTASGAVAVQGSFSITESQDTIAISGTAAIQGALAVIEASDAIAIDANTLVGGLLTVLEIADSITIAGAVLVSGSLAATEETDSVAVNGIVAVSGSIAVTEDTDTVAINAGLVNSGSVAVTEGADNIAITGQVRVAGALAVAEASDSIIVNGSSAVTGSLVVTEGADSAAITGALLIAGSLAVTEAVDVFASAGQVPVQGAIAVSEAADSVAIAAQVQIQGTLNVTEANDSIVVNGGAVTTGTLGVTEGTDTVAISGVLQIEGAVAVTEDADGVSVTGHVLITGVLATVEEGDTVAITTRLVNLGIDIALSGTYTFQRSMQGARVTTISLEGNQD